MSSMIRRSWVPPFVFDSSASSSKSVLPKVRLLISLPVRV
jgi:hypothetical protein